MLKLIKYEFRKQAFSKGVIFAIVALLEILFGIGILLSKENFIATSLGLLFIVGFGAMAFVAYESILTFSNDLKNKCSYMLFLTPNTSYSIVGAKVVTAALQVLVVGLGLLAFAILDATIVFAKYSSIEQIKINIMIFLEQVFNLNISVMDIFIVCLTIIVSWISVITLAFFSITLSTTFLANKKFKGLVSFAIFIALNLLFSYITKLTIGEVTSYNQNDFILSTLYYLCFTVLTYFGTAYMLEKKVSV